MLRRLTPGDAGGPVAARCERGVKRRSIAGLPVSMLDRLRTALIMAMGRPASPEATAAPLARLGRWPYLLTRERILALPAVAGLTQVQPDRPAIINNTSPTSIRENAVVAAGCLAGDRGSHGRPQAASIDGDEFGITTSQESRYSSYVCRHHSS